MQGKITYMKLGNRLTIRAIIGIVGLFVSILTLILVNILDLLGVFLFDPQFQMYFYASQRLIVILDVIFAFLIVNSIKNLKSEVQHIHFTQFHSNFLVGVVITLILLIYSFTGPFLFALFNSPFYDWDRYIIGSNIVYTIESAIGFAANVVVMNAWAHFSRFAKSTQKSPTIIRSINIVRVGYLFTTIYFMIRFFSYISVILVYTGFPFGYYFGNILFWGLFGFEALFMIISPILLILGRMQLAKLVKTTSFSASLEPTLGNNYEPRFNQHSNHKKYCGNCGTPAVQDATFCPFCGNSF